MRKSCVSQKVRKVKLEKNKNENPPLLWPALTVRALLVLNLLADRDQPFGSLLVRFVQQLDQVQCHIAIFVVEERGGQTEVTHTSGTTDTMDVLLDFVR